MSATYDVGEPLDPLERDDVDRRGMEELVGARWRLPSLVKVVEVESVRLTD